MKKCLSLTALIVLLFVLPLRAQFYFGKNKVQYTHFDWQVMTTEHFKVYYYTDEMQIARIGAAYAEESYRALAPKFNIEIKHKTPLIIYSSPTYFSQTNVIPGMLPESVAGFTEFLKGRVVLPFHGSFHDFEHVIRHELVHVFTLSKLQSISRRRHRFQIAAPPLWFIEGLAEFWSKPWDTEADMIVKDMVINDRFLSIDELYRVRGSYFMYKLGESVCHFIDTTYGPDKLTQIFDNYFKGRTFDEVVKISLGDNLKKVSEKWHYYLKKKYYPELADRGLPRMDSKPITAGGFAVKGVPIRYDDGHGEEDWVVYKANKLGYTGIYMKPLDADNGRTKTLLKGERSSNFESLYLLRSGIDAVDGKIVFSSKSKDRDVIYVYDLAEKKVTRRFEFADMITAHSPRLSPNAHDVVFNGVLINGISNLYILDITDGSYERLTNDIYYDTDPAFSDDGKSILFSSDRCAGGEKGALNIFRYDLKSKQITQLTYGTYRDLTPLSTENGIYFSSNRESGTFNIFMLDSTGALTRQSTYATGAMDPRLTPDGSRLTYTGYQNMSFQIYQMKLPVQPKEIVQPHTYAASEWKPITIESRSRSTTIKYDTDYSFDIAQSSIGYDPVYGSIGGVQAAVSDVLGNHAFHFLLTNTARTKDDFLDSFNFGITYINRERQLNWGVGAFHLYDEYYNDYDQYFFERQAGGIALLSYPMSKFTRFDFTTLAAYSKRDPEFGRPSREAFLVSNFLSYVYDNSLWDISGPIEGRRYNFTVGVSNDLRTKRTFATVAMADIRHYFRLGRYSAFANRLFGYTSSGVEPRRIYFGGSWSFRGFSRRQWYTRNVLFASTELRFPLIDRLTIGFPFGGLGFSSIRGALFFDTGSAWDDQFDQFLGSFGTGFRVALSYFIVFRFDFSRTTDFKTISNSTDFDFFFGWNF